MIKDLEIGILVCVIQVDPKCNPICLYKREAKVDLTQMEGEEAMWTMEAETEVIQPQAKGCREPKESRRGKTQVAPRASVEGGAQLFCHLDINPLKSISDL